MNFYEICSFIINMFFFFFCEKEVLLIFYKSPHFLLQHFDKFIFIKLYFLLNKYYYFYFLYLFFNLNRNSEIAF